MNYYQEHQSEFLEGLMAFLRIPSISTLPENKSDIRRAADFALNELRAAGMTAAELIEDSGGMKEPAKLFKIDRSKVEKAVAAELKVQEEGEEPVVAAKPKKKVAKR